MIDITPWSAIWTGMDAKPNHVVGFNTNHATDPSATGEMQGQKLLKHGPKLPMSPETRLVNSNNIYFMRGRF